MSVSDQPKAIKWDGTPVPPEQWGRDHISTLLYIETCCVDYGGKLDHQRLRPRDDRYPTRGNGLNIEGHGDLDCVHDFEAAGLLENAGSGLNPLVVLTDRGWRTAWALRRARAEKADLATLLEALRKIREANKAARVEAFTNRAAHR